MVFEVFGIISVLDQLLSSNMFGGEKMKLEECKIVVTGGAGFVGSHLTEVLLKRGCEVTILDNLSNGFIENISHLLNRGNKVNLIQGDVRDIEVCLKAVEGADVVFHEAAQINPVLAVEDPSYDFEINARGTLNMLEAARKKDVKKFIFASTNVYANPKYLSIDENHPIDLLSPYAASKLSGEAYCIVYNNTYGLKAVRLRYTNIYGPRQRSTKNKSGVITIFIESVLKGTRPIIFGDGEQTRDFIYVSDVVQANILAAESGRGQSGAFNIGFGQETSINTLANIILKIADREDLVPEKGPGRAADFKRCMVDITKARKELGFNPETTLEIGLKSTIDWWKESS
jgi:UDP-glucose 4-epimerase